MKLMLSPFQTPNSQYRPSFVAAAMDVFRRANLSGELCNVGMFSSTNLAVSSVASLSRVYWILKSRLSCCAATRWAIGSKISSWRKPTSRANTNKATKSFSRPSRRISVFYQVAAGTLRRTEPHRTMAAGDFVPSRDRPLTPAAPFGATALTEWLPSKAPNYTVERLATPIDSR